jgi:flavin-binding protein dodecin
LTWVNAAPPAARSNGFSATAGRRGARRPDPEPEDVQMNHVVKTIEVSAASDKSVEDAVRNGLHKIAATVSGIQGAWISETKVRTDPEGRILEWRVVMRVSFLVL